MKRIIAASMIFAMLIGCVEFQQTVKSINQSLEKNLTTEGKATLEVGAAAALLGAAAGRIIGKDTKSTIAGAVAGAIIGGVAANWYVRRVEARAKELQGRENDLDARIQYAKKVNSDAEEYNNRLKKQLKDTKDKIEDLRARKNKNKIAQSTLEKERQVLSNQIEAAEDNKALLTAQLDELKKFRNEHNSESKQLDVQIASLEKSLEEVKKNTYELASINI